MSAPSEHLKDMSHENLLQFAKYSQSNDVYQQNLITSLEDDVHTLANNNIHQRERIEELEAKVIHLENVQVHSRGRNPNW